MDFTNRSSPLPSEGSEEESSGSLRSSTSSSKSSSSNLDNKSSKQLDFLSKNESYKRINNLVKFFVFPDSLPTNTPSKQIKRSSPFQVVKKDKDKKLKKIVKRGEGLILEPSHPDLTGSFLERKPSYKMSYYENTSGLKKKFKRVKK